MPVAIDQRIHEPRPMWRDYIDRASAGVALAIEDGGSATCSRRS